MRRFLIQRFLPLILCSLPLLGGLLVAVAAPKKLRDFYLDHLRVSPIDWIILGLGIPLFTAQMILTWRAPHRRDTGFDESRDRWLSHLVQAAEWFPMLGLIGTVMGILQTFSEIAAIPDTSTNDIIRLYAPAITATGSGLFMALLNLFPTWVVLIGRDLILSLGGAVSSSEEDQP